MSNSSRAELTWLGQAGFQLNICGLSIVIDPYLSDSLAKKYRGSLFPHNRLVAPPVSVKQLNSCDYYLCTHGHTDHMDPETIRPVEDLFQPTFIYPRFESNKAAQRGIPVDRDAGINAGEIISLNDDVSLMAIPAAHEQLVVNEKSEYEALGYVVITDGLVIYHSGDCVPYAGQANLLKSLGVNVALLPVNGRDDYRTSNGVPGNFHDFEAIELCLEAGIETLIPHHWGMFDFNTIDTQKSESLNSLSDVKVVIPKLGKPIQLQFGGRVSA